MYDIFYISQNPHNSPEYKKLKSKFPMTKVSDDVITAQEQSLTEFFWIVWDDVIIDDSFEFNYVPKDRTKEYIHSFLNGTTYDGVVLIPKKAPITKKETEHRFFIKKINIAICASKPKNYDIFVIETYDDYLNALEQSKTEMFWATSNNLKISENFDFSLHFSRDNMYDLHENHVFVHVVNGEELYNGVFLLSKKNKLSKREIEYRQLVNRKEWPMIASGPIEYDLFVIDTYDEYLKALANSKTEMFWATSNNLKISENFDFSLHFSRDNMYDLHENHVFVHVVNGEELYNGVFLLSKKNKLSKREIEYRQLVNRKEWPMIASGPIEYDLFVIDTYDEYLKALANSKTEMFWATSNNLKINPDFKFDLYLSHDEYDRHENHAFIHRVNGEDLYNGVFLFSKHKPVTEKEIKHRYLVERKEWPIVASGPIEYDRFVIETYDDYLTALEQSKTEMFWATSNNLKINPDFKFDLYLSHDEYDRHENHAFIHRVNGEDLYNGVFLFSKHKPVTEKEIKHRHLVERKEWDIVASGPIEYDRFVIDTYDEYLDALTNSKTEMFWAIPNYVSIAPSTNFDLYFTYNQTFERNINHVFLNGKYNDGIVLCSKYSKFSRREFDYKFIANKVETPIIMSSPKPYDVVFISYKEPNADENYARLLSKRADAKRVHGVVGIHNAHIEAAKIAETDMLWIVDGDALIVDDFNFDYQVPRWDREVVHVWRSKNPINDLVYGYGGVKLFPRFLTINMDTSKPDMTTSISTKFKAINEISNITAFNTDPFNTWKSAFRECAKLSSKIIDRQKDDETQNRLRDWCTIGNDRIYGEYAIAGAKQGAIYGYSNKNNMEKLKLINDFNWLEEQFKNANT